MHHQSGHMFSYLLLVLSLLQKLLAQIIKLRVQLLDHPVKTILLENTGEFTFQVFDDNCMSISIDVEYQVAHAHTQNRLTKSFIKHIQMLTRPLFLRSQLSTSTLGLVILQTISLVCVRPSAFHQYSLLQFVFDQPPNIFHLKIFDCAVYTLIFPPQ